MIKSLATNLVLVLWLCMPALVYHATAQTTEKTPGSFNYQAAARDAQGDVMSNTSINLRISILEGSSDGELVYAEGHRVKTNLFGLFELQIGRGIPFDNKFENINWGETGHWLKVELDVEGNGEYVLTGTSEILSVPYAIHAKEAERIIGGIPEALSTIWHDGNGAPDASLGTENDYYLDITSSDIYKKNADGWEYRGSLNTDNSPSGETRADPNDWTTSGNAGTTPGTNYIGTSDNIGLSIRTNATEAIRVNTGGQVGIGVSSPGATLDIGNGTPARGPQTDLVIGHDGDVPQFELYNTSGSGALRYHNTAGFQLYNWNGGWDEVLRLNPDGKMSLGGVNPGALLDLGTGATARGGGVTDLLIGPNGNDPQIEFYDDTESGAIKYQDGVGFIFYTNGSSWDQILTLRENTSRVGVGVSVPATKLDVDGQITLRSGAVDGYFLQSDATGTGSWVNSETGIGWRRANNTTVYNTGDSVGINTTDPLRPLHIMGSTTLSSMILTPNEPFSGDDASIIMAEDDDDTYHMEMKYDGGDNRMYWYGKNNASLNGPHMGINRDNGRVGIGTGTTNPVTELEVVGTVTATAFDAGDASGLLNVYADSLRGSMQADTNDILQWNGAFWNRIPYGRYGFHASASTDQTVGDTAYDTLRCNNSSSGENFECPAGVYDNATYAFEAPVDGIYFFEAAVLWDNANLAEARNAIFIRVNNTDEVGEWSVSGGIDFFGTGVSTTLELNEGDEVRIRVYNGDNMSMDTFSQSGKYCYFSGFLVFAQ